MKELKMMFRLLRASAKSQMMYRANFIIGLLGTLAYNGKVDNMYMCSRDKCMWTIEKYQPYLRLVFF